MKTVIVISRDVVLTSTVENRIRQGCRVILFDGIQSALGLICSTSPPDLIVLDVDPGDPVTAGTLSQLKEDPMFRNLTVLAVLGDENAFAQCDALLFEDYIWRRAVETEILRRVNLCIMRSERIVEINPLTRLPGNISINREIQERLDRGEAFALAWADLDQFKPLNDKYGFSRGDDIIRITGRLILGAVKDKQREHSFVGHIGGDDFVYIMNPEAIEAASRELVATFDQIIPGFYDAEDRERGSIRSVDRQGKARDFPLTSISIGITDTASGPFGHFGEMTERASEMKKYAKQFPGSCFKWDRRKR
ncbi:MAG: response regulator PleD [Syntrophaceae bacterium PtaB.Bin038]|nr:MAG: response regulator PleD [Syntrophaceae bacterium PtaB.Bin038]